MLILIVAGGPDKGRVFQIDQRESFTLGREGDPVALGDRKASRQHAKMTLERQAGRDRWFVEDLGSRHGTYRNHKKIDAKTRVRDGDHLQIGETLVVVSRTEQAGGAGAGPTGDASDSQHGVTAAGGGSSHGSVAGLPVTTITGPGGVPHQLVPMMQPVAMPLAQGGAQGGGLSRKGAIGLAAGLAVVGGIGIANLVQGARDRSAIVAGLDRPAAVPAELDAAVRGIADAEAERATALAEMSQKLDALDGGADALILSRLDDVQGTLDADAGAAALLARLEGLAADLEAGGARADALAEQMLARLDRPAAPVALDAQSTARLSDALAAGMSDELAERVSARLSPMSAEEVERLAAIVARLADQLPAAAAIADLEVAVRGVPDSLSPAFAAVLKRLDRVNQGVADVGELSAAVADLRAQDLPTLADRLDDALSRLAAAQSGIETGLGELAALPTADEFTKSLVELDRRAAERTAALQSRVDERLAGVARGDDMARLMEELLKRPDADLIREQLDAFAGAGDDAVATQLLAALEAAPERNRAVLEEMLDEVLTAIPHSDAAPDADTVLAQVDARIAALEDGLAERLGAGLKEALAEREGQAEADAPPPSMDELRGLIRAEFLAAAADLTQQQAAATAAEGAAGAASPASDLSRVQRAYRRAWETGRAQSLPARGDEPAREVDPLVARQMGVETWEDWYELEYRAEQMRATRRRNGAGGSFSDPSVIGLPPAGYPRD